MHGRDTTAEGRIAHEEAAADPGDPYTTLIEIARDHGAEEIKHLTRAYQAIAPSGGGRIIDLTALVDDADTMPRKRAEPVSRPQGDDRSPDERQ